MGERQSVAQKGIRAIDARASAARNGSSAAGSVRVPGCQQISVNTLFCVMLWAGG